MNTEQYDQKNDELHFNVNSAIKDLMKLLVTGGLGFIGSNFCRHTLTKHSDYQLTNIDKIGIGANPANLRDVENDKRYTFIKGDICNPQQLKKIIHHVDAVVNIAAETHVDRSIAEPYNFLQNNTTGTFTILEALRKHNKKAKLVQVSTDEVYGQALEGSFKETQPLTPSNPYSASKAAADMFVLAYCKTYGLNASITRCTNNFGPYQLPEKLIPKTIIRALKNLPIPVYGSGTNIRDWIYVTDHCQAIDIVLHKGAPGEVYNVSANNEISNIEIAKKILTTLDKPETLITFVEDRPAHDLRYSIDSTKIQTELSWKPKTSFPQALESTIKWYVENEHWWTPYATEDILHPTPWKLGGAH
jgi:dTDP-glucose 4,6-dehydratase